MNSLQSIIGTLPGNTISFVAMLLTAAQLAVFLRLFRKKHGRIQTGFALLHFLLGFFFLSVFLNYSYNALLRGRTEIFYSFEQRLLSLPWFLYAVLECISAAVILFCLRSFRQQMNSQLTSDSIRQTVDLLPTSVLISDTDGTVLLTNLIMTKLCRVLTGELLSNAGRFWQYIESKDKTNHLIHTPEKEVWKFTKSRLTLDSSEYDQVIATNMTEQYRITEELSDRNRHLKEMLAHMRSVVEKERSLIAVREVMNARMTVHNRIGAVLLTGKYYLDHPENVKEEELLHLLEYNNRFLLAREGQPEQKINPLQEAVLAAGKIGVSTEIHGSLPENENVCRLMAQAVEQCAANAVRHAGGDRLFIWIEENKTLVTADFSNNGRAPEGPVTETGGLAVLRKAVQKAGGVMTVQSEPSFLLTLSVPKQ